MPTMLAPDGESRPSRFLLFFPLTYMAGIFLLSSLPGIDVGQNAIEHNLVVWLTPLVQNLLHIPLFAGLAITWSWSLRAMDIERVHRAGLSLFLTIMYAAFDEWHQSLVAGRYASTLDLALDALGACLGIALVSYQRA